MDIIRGQHVCDIIIGIYVAKIVDIVPGSKL